MAYNTLKAAVQAAIKNNDNEEITGDVLQGVLLSIVNSVGSGYNFAGLATPSTNPGTPDGSMFWIGGKGIYANFGSTITVPDGFLGLFMWDGSNFSSSTLGVGDTFWSPDVKLGRFIRELYVSGNINGGLYMIVNYTPNVEHGVTLLSGDISNPTTIASFYTTTDSWKDEILVLSEFNSSGVSGLVVVDWSVIDAQIPITTINKNVVADI